MCFGCGGVSTLPIFLRFGVGVGEGVFFKFCPTRIPPENVNTDLGNLSTELMMTILFSSVRILSTATSNLQHGKMSTR